MKQYFFVSSAVAYSFEDAVITENTRLGNKFWNYGSDKVKCENFICSNYKKYGICYTIIRPYITYGKTRIPFGIIPESGEYWTLANRVLNDKPILMWDDGKARCTLTNTEDFARAFVDLIGNLKAYNEAFHITSGEVLTWADVLKLLGKELGKSPIVFSSDTKEIIKLLPEYYGLLLGDKARDRVFDNSKILDAAPNFMNLKPFSVGIAETIKYYQNNPIERTVNYEWDGRIDWAIIQLAKQSGNSVELAKLRFVSAEKGVKLSDQFAYWRGRYPVVGKTYSVIAKLAHFPKKVARFTLIKIKNIKFHKKSSSEGDLKNAFHFLGHSCKFGNCDFGKDMKLISIGSNVQIQDGVKFINYRPSAEHFDKLLNAGRNHMLRDLGPIIIEDNVFIGADVLILPNVTIGKNSLILNGSVITKTIPENSVVCGNPAHVVDNIDSWYSKMVFTNKSYPWFDKELTHAEIVKEREAYFFEGSSKYESKKNI